MLPIKSISLLPPTKNQIKAKKLVIVVMGSSTETTTTTLISRNKKIRVIQELVHGQDCATQLQILFHNPSSEEGGGRRRQRQQRLIPAEELVEKILRSFDETISVLSSTTCCDSSSANDEATNYSCRDSPAAGGCDEPKSEDSSESRRRLAAKDRRGCYKRKRSAETWTVVSATMEDGHAWRKYGQKEILNSTQPRSYFRCRHKHDQGCKATKQVQRMEDESQIFQTTYIGTHTCRDSFMATPRIITDSSQYQITVPKIPTIKQESKESETTATTPTPSDVTDQLDSMLIWKDIIMGGEGGFDEYSSHPAAMGSSHNYGYSFADEFESCDFHFGETDHFISL